MGRRCVEQHSWPRCEGIEPAAPLVEMAAEFDRVAREQHLAGDGLLRNLELADDLSTVARWKQHPNVVLWSGMYLASQSLRWTVTGDGVALDNARTVVAGLRRLTEVTSRPGLYGRTLAAPGVLYDSDGGDSPHWIDSTAPGYAGWRWEDDVSQDGYAGLMFGYAAALEHLQGTDVHEEVRRLVAELVERFVADGLQIIDHTGEVTEHGWLYHTAFDNFPGFNAMLASSWVKVGATANDDAALDDFYYGCLMHARPDVSCPVFDEFDTWTYIESMEERLGLFRRNCQQNYDNFDMTYQAIYPLLRRESDASLQQRLVDVLRNHMFHTEDPELQSVATIGNSMLSFIYAGLTCDGPEEPIVEQAIEDAVCKLKSFPQVKFDKYIPAGTQPEVCRNRLDQPVAAEPIPLDEYYLDHYLWRMDFFEIQPERPENRSHLFSPEDFLIAYWLGRYHGFIHPDE
ncbi:MAG: hypothetical protein JRI23_11570 [Deltaproteobacteria bacterium]|nr:hypothetical protein [Deltaproteobacteria bacterium]MBW2532337.1 hypothetical protein [Deltaproteobacteria bacterium]